MPKQQQKNSLDPLTLPTEYEIMHLGLRERMKTKTKKEIEMSKNILEKKIELHRSWLADNEKGARLNLSCEDLEGANLEGVDLTDANLEGANMAGTYLEGANLKGANLKGANLVNADMEDAILSCADLRGSNLKGAYLECAKFRCANLMKANLDGVDLTGADLEGADMEDAILSGANLTGANLVNADLRGGSLRGATMEGANLTGADLRGANFQCANLERANIEGTRVEGANFGHLNGEEKGGNFKEDPESFLQDVFGGLPIPLSIEVQYNYDGSCRALVSLRYSKHENTTIPQEYSSYLDTGKFCAASWSELQATVKGWLEVKGANLARQYSEVSQLLKIKPENILWLQGGGK